MTKKYVKAKPEFQIGNFIGHFRIFSFLRLKNTKILNYHEIIKEFNEFYTNFFTRNFFTPIFYTIFTPFFPIGVQKA